MKTTGDGILKKYAALARKLGKLPTARDVQKHICSERQVGNLFESFSKLKSCAVELYPDLKELEVPARLVETDLEIYRINEDKKQIRKQNKQLIQDVSLLDYVSKFSDKVFTGKVKAPKVYPSKKPIKRIATLMLSDLHFGADIKADETTVDNFGIIEEARRFAAVIKQASEYKPQYRKETKLVVALLGDIIENSMHDARTGAELSEQICRAIHLLIQGIAVLANTYPEVEVVCATGNHDRMSSRHHGRAVHGKYDSHSTVIYYAVKKALAAYKNITVTIPKSPIAHYDVFGKKIAYTHGDGVIKMGGIYNTLNVKSIESQINKINAALTDETEYAAILSGHVHIASVIHLSNGCVMITNAALPPPDPFAVSIGCFESNNGQWIFESIEGFPVGDMRLIKCGRDYDKDQSLDSIVQPWVNY